MIVENRLRLGPNSPSFETYKADGIYSKNLHWNFNETHCETYYTAIHFKFIYKYVYNVLTYLDNSAPKSNYVLVKSIHLFHTESKYTNKNNNKFVY